MCGEVRSDPGHCSCPRQGAEATSSWPCRGMEDSSALRRCSAKEHHSDRVSAFSSNWCAFTSNMVEVSAYPLRESRVSRKFVRPPCRRYQDAAAWIVGRLPLVHERPPQDESSRAHLRPLAWAAPAVWLAAQPPDAAAAMVRLKRSVAVGDRWLEGVAEGNGTESSATGRPCNAAATISFATRWAISPRLCTARPKRLSRRR